VQPERSIAYVLRITDVGMTSNGVITFTAVDDKSSKVSWTNEGDFGNNPFTRYFGLMMDSWVGKDYDASLARLKALVEKSNAPAAAPVVPAAASEPAKK
jgi:Polyketide cyclase / dehydrase and lipid transport